MINNMIIASVNSFTSGTPDKNGKNPVILNVVAGTFPNRNVLAGTIAENLKIEVGETYLFQVRELEANEHGRQFAYSVLKKLSALEIVTAAAQMGAAVMINIDAKESKEQKSDIFANAEEEFTKSK